jgi:5-methylcytosine-specific restriction endonuclease McrA
MHNFTCHFCSVGFTANNSRAKYCSGNCKTKAWYCRNKDDVEFRNKHRDQRRVDRAKRSDEINARRVERFKTDTEYRTRTRINTAVSRKRKPQAENNKTWRLANPYKAMLKNLRKRGQRLVDAADLKYIFERDNGECQYCGSTEQPSLDHRHPVSRGGDSSIDNLCVACQSCNSRKGTKTVEEFLIYLEEIKC